MATPTTPAYNIHDPNMSNPLDRENAANFSKEFQGFDPSPLAKGRGKGRWVLVLERKVVAMHVNMRAMQPPPCVVVNMNPFPLRVNGVLHDDLVVPACPPQYDFITYEIPTYKTTVIDGGDLKFDVMPVPPMALAYEFEREFGGEDCQGGVFYYPGNFSIHGEDGKFNPAAASIKVKRLCAQDGSMEEVTIGELFQAAQAKMRAYCMRMIREAENEMLKPNGHRNIVTNVHRRCVVVAHNHGWIAEVPAWVARTKEEAKYGEKCPSCRTQLEEAQVVCGKCFYVADVEQAFALGMIQTDNPALKRLGAKRLLELNFSHEQVAYLIPGYSGAEKLPRKTATAATDDDVVAGADAPEGAETKGADNAAPKGNRGNRNKGGDAPEK